MIPPVGAASNTTGLGTEQTNSRSERLDQMSSGDIAALFIDSSKDVTQALEKAKPDIAAAIDDIYGVISNECEKPQNVDNKTKPRIFYFGAGTSGRLGILDASECPPTFSTEPEMVQGIIAGGDKAIKDAVEGAEDDKENKAAQIIADKAIGPNDVVIGISASGRTPFVVNALKAAKEKGALTVAIANNAKAESFEHADHSIFLDTGPEILSGSTRLKAGTSQKEVLNLISTALMVKLGKVYKNLMVDVKVSNEKLKARAINLITKITGTDQDTAATKLEEAANKVKTAIVMISKNLGKDAAEQLLEQHNGFLRQALD